jgi:hypothetical protein
MGKACGMYERQERCLQGFGGEFGMKNVCRCQEAKSDCSIPQLAAGAVVTRGYN